jgi:hypothetical protein
MQYQGPLAEMSIWHIQIEYSLIQFEKSFLSSNDSHQQGEGPPKF